MKKQKFLRKDFLNAPRGITLIALVVTIVVLLILATVSINLVAGGDGIISKASKAVDEQTKASMKEQVAMYVSEATYDYYLNNPDNMSYLEFMEKYLENEVDAISFEDTKTILFSFKISINSF